MRILVCVKQVPDIDAPIAVDVSGGWIIPPRTAFRMNRFDEFAVEEALSIKETHAATVVDALSVGPPRVRATIRRAMEMGADNGIHIALPVEGYSDPRVIATLIQTYARDWRYDLILCGAMSEDFMQAQVGPLLAEMLDIPCIGSVIEERLAGDGAHLEAEQEGEGGMRQRFEILLPALICVQTGINRPRYPSLSNVLRAKRQEIGTIAAAEIQVEEGCAFRSPEPTSRGVLLSGSMQEKARTMLRILHEHALL